MFQYFLNLGKIQPLKVELEILPLIKEKSVIKNVNTEIA